MRQGLTCIVRIRGPPVNQTEELNKPTAWKARGGRFGLHYIPTPYTNYVLILVHISNRLPEENELDEIGDAYTFIGMERNTKLNSAWHLGRRMKADTMLFMRKL